MQDNYIIKVNKLIVNYLFIFLYFTFFFTYFYFPENGWRIFLFLTLVFACISIYKIYYDVFIEFNLFFSYFYFCSLASILFFHVTDSNSFYSINREHIALFIYLFPSVSLAYFKKFLWTLLFSVLLVVLFNYTKQDNETAVMIMFSYVLIGFFCFILVFCSIFIKLIKRIAL